MRFLWARGVFRRVTGYRTVRVALCLLLAVAVLIMGYQLAPLSAKGWFEGILANAGLANRQAVLPALTIPADALLVGDVWDKQSLERIVSITNNTKDELTCQLSASCNCVTLDPSECVLGSGGTSEVKVVIRPPRPSGESTPFRMDLIGRINRPPGVFRWTLEGVYGSNLSFSPGSVQIADDAFVLGPQVERQILISSRVPLKALSVHGEEQVVRCDMQPSSPLGHRFVLCAKLTDLCLSQPRELDTSLKILPVAVDGRDLPSADLPLKVTVRHDVTAKPSRVFFGAHTQGELLQDTIVLSSHQNLPYSADVVSTSSKLLQVSKDAPKDEYSNLSSSFTLRYELKTLGDTREHVTLSVRDGVEERAYTITVPVVIFGTPSTQPHEARVK